MFATPIETVCFIFLNASELDGKFAPVDEGSGCNPEDDANVEILEDRADDMTAEGLPRATEALARDQQAELVALTWFGRRDFKKSNWREALKAAREAWTNHAAGYLVGKPQLGDLLEQGMPELGYSCSEIEAQHL